MSALLRELSKPDVKKAVLEAPNAEEVVRVLGGEPAPDLETVSALFAAAGHGDAEPVADVLDRTPPAYIAELCEDLGPDDRARLLARMEHRRAASIVEDMHLVPAAAAFRRMSPEVSASVRPSISRGDRRRNHDARGHVDPGERHGGGGDQGRGRVPGPPPDGSLRDVAGRQAHRQVHPA